MTTEMPANPLNKSNSRARTRKERKEASAFDGVGVADFSGYIFDQTKVFLNAAQERDLEFLAYLLEMVAAETARLRDKK